jgi:hypothetical protein
MLTYYMYTAPLDSGQGLMHSGPLCHMESYFLSVLFNLLKPSGNFTYDQV